jgi:hypothetical protein
VPWAVDSETLWRSPAPKDKGGQFVATREGGEGEIGSSLVVRQLRRFQKPKEVWRGSLGSLGRGSLGSLGSSSGGAGGDGSLAAALALRPWLLPDTAATAPRGQDSPPAAPFFWAGKVSFAASTAVSAGHALSLAAEAEAAVVAAAAAAEAAAAGAASGTATRGTTPPPDGSESPGGGSLREGNLVLDLKDGRARARAFERLHLFTRTLTPPRPPPSLAAREFCCVERALGGGSAHEAPVRTCGVSTP